MKALVFTFLFLIKYLQSFCQPISFGQSIETLSMPDGLNWTVGYYKPANYDSLNSEIILYCHGQGGNANEGYSLFSDIANRRKALIVSPTNSVAPWSNAFSGIYYWLPTLFKSLYRHILIREDRDTINVRLVGFSAGGQCVTRYMLIRQGIADSIPIKMAVSLNPYYYTFPTNFSYCVNFYWPCGIGQDSLNPYYVYMGSYCQEHLKSYFNENYSVLIGTADTIPVPGPNPYWACIDSQGVSRYERAINFYNFCTQNALQRSTTLKWQYGEIPGVGHSGYPLANTKLYPTDTVTICEHYLFDIPYHEPEKFPPTADFNYVFNDTSQCMEVKYNCRCWWQTVPTTYSIDYDNGFSGYGINTSTNYLQNGNYNVQLIVNNSRGSDTIIKQIIIYTAFPFSDFSAIDTVKPITNSQITFVNNSLNMDSCLWYFGDGLTSTETNPVHQYADTGKFTVSLIAYKNNGCSDTLIKNNYIRIYDPVGINNNSLSELKINLFNQSGNLKLYVYSPVKTNIQPEIRNMLGQSIIIYNEYSVEPGKWNLINLDNEIKANSIYFLVLKSLSAIKSIRFVNQ